MKNTSLLFFLISTCIPTQKEMSRETFIQDATSQFANGDDSRLIRDVFHAQNVKNYIYLTDSALDFEPRNNKDNINLAHSSIINCLETIHCKYFCIYSHYKTMKITSEEAPSEAGRHCKGCAIVIINKASV